MKRLLKQFTMRLRLKDRIMLAYVLSVLLPLLCVGILLYVNISGTLAQYLLQSGRMALEQSALTIGNRVKAMEDTLNIAVADTRTNTFFEHIVKNKDYGFAEQYIDYNSVKNMLYSLQRISGIYRLRLYVPDSFYYSKEGDSFNSLEPIRDRRWYGELNAGGSIFVYFEDDYIDYAGVSRSVLSVARLVRNPDNYSRYIAVIKAECEVSEIIKQIGYTEGGSMLFLLPPGEGVVAADSASAGLWATASRGVPENSWTIVKSKDGNPGYLLTLPIGDTGWKIACAMPAKSVYSLRNERFLILIIGLAVVSAATYAFARTVSAMSARRLEKLTNKMRRVQSGDLDVSAEDLGSDEIGEINSRFNTMVSELRELLKNREELNKRIEKTELKAVRAKINALQSQINPHFLYNTLDLILWKALYNEIPLVERLVQSLADYYKLNLSNGSDIVMLRHEAEHVKSYVTIQNMRHEDAFTLDIDIGDAGTCLLPKITLQPLVENAILHGILESGRNGGRIRIAASAREGLLRLSVEDNGGGIPAETLAKLNGSASGDGGIGVSNVNERIGLYFGREYALRFACLHDGGTEVLLEIPAVTEMDFFASRIPDSQI